MTTSNRVYDLLPYVYRERDAANGSPLAALLGVIDDQLGSLEADIRTLYDDLFIETCQGRLIDFFADLVNVRLTSPVVSSPGDLGSTGPDTSLATAQRRLQVLRALSDRRGKGTLRAIEQVAFEATGWPIRVTEEQDRVGSTQGVNGPQLARGRLLDLRAGDRLVTIETPFATEAAYPDVRRGGTHRTEPIGPSVTSVNVAAWRLPAHRVQLASAYCENDDNIYTFDPFGREQPLAVYPVARRPGAQPAGDLDVPNLISRTTMARCLEDFYGPDRSICVYESGRPVPRHLIEVADLSRDENGPAAGHVALDPESGRIAFSERREPTHGVSVRYAYLGVGPLGGGSYRRPAVAVPEGATVYRVARGGEAEHRTIGGALSAWKQDIDSGKSMSAVLEIMDDGVYEESFDIRLAVGESLEIRAAPGRRPALHPSGRRSDRPRRLRVLGATTGSDAHQPNLTLDGLWIVGHAIELGNRLGRVTIRHCTVSPPGSRGEEHRLHPAIVVTATVQQIAVESSIVGPVRVTAPEVGLDPIAITVSDSIVDAGLVDGAAIAADAAIDEQDNEVVADPAHLALTMCRSTVFGRVFVRRTVLIEDSILASPFRSDERQTGMVRHSYVTGPSRTPRRADCQPDGVLEVVEERWRRGELSEAEAQQVARTEVRRVRPRFASRRFGEPGYGRLQDSVAKEIKHGAHDEGELGSSHDQWLARRAENLRARLEEFIPVGFDIDIDYVI